MMSARNPGEVRQALTKSLEGLEPEAPDAALIALLYAYADMVDGSDDRAYVLEKCGTGFLSALKQMGLTPAARAAITGNGLNTKKPEVSGLTLLQRDRKRSTGQAG